MRIQLLWITFAYLLGSVPFGLLLGRMKGVDIRHQGSGNIGATNLARSVGRTWGVLAFILDFLKGTVPTWLALAAFLRPEAGFWQTEAGLAPWLPPAVGVAAVLGHVSPLYLKFRGGKGVATAFGALTALSWPATLAAGGVWLLLFLITRTVSIASLASALALPIALVLVRASVPPEVYPWTLGVTIFLAVLIFARHRANLVRLFRGEEFRFR